MLKLIGPVQQLLAASEPSAIGDLAVDTPINYGRYYAPCGGPIGQTMHSNLGIFVLLFTVCAIEVMFMKIVTAIREGMRYQQAGYSSGDGDGSARSSLAYFLRTRDQNNNSSSFFDNNNSSSVGGVHRDAWNWVTSLHQAIQPPMTEQRRGSTTQHYISTHTFLERIARATEDRMTDENNNYL